MHYFITPLIVKGDIGEVYEERVVHQMRRVLRMRAGDYYIIQRQDIRYTMTISTITQDAVIWTIWQALSRPDLSRAMRTLIIALPQQVSTTELIVQKCTEIWLDCLIFFPSQRSQIRDLSTSKIKRCQTIALEAAEQSHRWTVPEIVISDRKTIVDMSPGAYMFSLSNSISRDVYPDTTQSLIGLIWPEWWWTQDEEEALVSVGAMKISLGETVLRMETAAIVGWWRMMQERT